MKYLSLLTHKLAKRYSHTTTGDFIAKYEDVFFWVGVIPMPLIILIAGKIFEWNGLYTVGFQFLSLAFQIAGLFVNTISSKINSFYDFDKDIYTPEKYLKTLKS